MTDSAPPQPPQPPLTPQPAQTPQPPHHDYLTPPAPANEPPAGPPPLPPASPDRLGPPDTPEVFAPPSDAWRRVSPRLATVRRITASIWLLPITLALAIGAWLATGLWWAAAAAALLGLAWWAWLWVRAGRVVASYGYAERDADLCLTHGLWFKELTVVPFGRMQVVKVSSGPILRAHGLANVELVTAAIQTGAVVPGLPLDEARVLRDRLIELSDAKGSGL